MELSGYQRWFWLCCAPRYILVLLCLCCTQRYILPWCAQKYLLCLKIYIWHACTQRYFWPRGAQRCLWIATVLWEIHGPAVCSEEVLSLLCLEKAFTLLLSEIPSYTECCGSLLKRLSNSYSPQAYCMWVPCSKQYKVTNLIRQALSGKQLLPQIKKLQAYKRARPSCSRAENDLFVVLKNWCMSSNDRGEEILACNRAWCFFRLL